MKDLYGAVSAESLKLKRTLALRLAVWAPLLLVLLAFGAEAWRGDPVAHGENPTEGFARGILTLWVFLLLPFCAALVAALLAALEHQGDNWKHILALPISPHRVYFAKWITGGGLVVLSSIALLIGICAAAALLRFIRPGWRGAALPLTMAARGVMLTFCAATLLFSIHMWISLRWRNFVPGIAVGIIGVIINIIIIPDRRTFLSVAHFFPWSLPAVAMAPDSPHRALGVLWGLLGGLAVGTIACWHLSRRECQ